MPGFHAESTRTLTMFKRRVTEPYDSVDYASEPKPEKNKDLGLQPDSRFIGKPLLHRGGKQ
ncbi:hypothetical protein CIK74_00510 [Glutamicibacter sp. BW77]|nr:hypothetical protein CIK74_00510 [Glutamicibacter sp. BW77]